MRYNDGSIHPWASDHMSLKSLHGGVVNTSADMNVLYSHSDKFMFVRNPYTRLYIAHRDKIMNGFSYQINSLIDDRSKKRNNRLQPFTLLALLNISFTETIHYGLGDYKTTCLDELKSQYRFCDVCNIRYDFIGKFETFEQDFETFLRTRRHSDIVKTMKEDATALEDNEEKIIKETVWQTFWAINKRNYDYWTKDICEVKDVLMRRLWQHFQIRGLIKDSSRYPVTNKNCSVDEREFQKMTLEAWRQPASVLERETQKYRYYLQAYRSVPLSVLKSFRSSVSRDCQLFHYDCSPANIFAGRVDGDEENNVFSDVKFIYD